jgi:hypothetical protein
LRIIELEFRFFDKFYHSVLVLREEWQLPYQNLECGDTKGPYVYRFIVTHTVKHFGSLVLKGPCPGAESQSFDFPLLSHGDILLSNSKIYDFDFIEFATYQDVIGLDIAMTDALSVNVDEGREDHFNNDLSALLR